MEELGICQRNKSETDMAVLAEQVRQGKKKEMTVRMGGVTKTAQRQSRKALRPSGILRSY